MRFRHPSGDSDVKWMNVDRVKPITRHMPHASFIHYKYSIRSSVNRPVSKIRP